MVTITNRAFQTNRLKRILDNTKEYRVYLMDTSDDGQTLIVFLDFREKFTAIERKALVVDKLAKILGKENDHGAFSATIGMNWVGEKGVDGKNEPFIVLEIPIYSIESIADILNKYSEKF